MISRLNAVSATSGLGRVLRFFMNQIPKSMVMLVRGGINQGFRWVVGTSIHRCWLGSYEPEVQALVAKVIQPCQVVWDVGANAGFYTLGFSRLVGPKGHVYAFEPLGSNVKNLLYHIQLNALLNVTLVQLALGDASSMLNFDTGESHQKGFLTTQATGYLVPCLTADEFLQGQPQAVPAFLKVDVEGAESALLTGAAALFTKHRPVLLLALHGDEQREQCFQLLRGYGYDLETTLGVAVQDAAGCGEEILAWPQARPEPVLA